MSTNILIAGCGYLGNKLGTLLVKQGHQVWGLRNNIELLPTVIHPIKVNLLQIDSFPTLPQIDYVYYMLSPNQRTEQAYEQTYIHAQKNLLMALNNQSIYPTHYFFISSTAVYGYDDGRWINENTKPNLTNNFSKLLITAEELAKNSALPTTILRFSGIYGAGRVRLINQLKLKQATCRKDPPQYINQIHIDDCAEFLAYLLQIKPSSTYLVSDNEPVSKFELLHWLANKIDVANPKIDNAIISTRGNKRVSSKHLQESGYNLIYPSYKQGYNNIINSL